MRKKVTLTIDKDVYEKSHSLGFNVSKVCENYLKILNTTMENPQNANQPFSVEPFPQKRVMAGGEGFEPSTPNLGGSWSGTAEDWNGFRQWIVKKKYRGGYGSTIFNYAQQYSDGLFKHDLSGISSLSDGLRPNVLKALSALAKFTGCYEDWKLLLKNYGLSWVGRSKDDVFIDRLTGVGDSEEIWTWIKTVKDARPELESLLDLMSISGLRFVEGVNSYNLILQLNDEGKLTLDRTGRDYRSGYFNKEVSSLEHFWFGDLFLRNTKKAFVSFVPEQLVTQICELKALSSAGAVKKLVQKRGLPLRFGDIREAHGTFMTKFLKESEISFLHGRVSSSVFMSNYFNPSLIGDLQDRVFQGIKEIQEKIKV